jgi:ribosomal protein L34E
VEGRALLQCAECGRTREVSGEIPEEYTASFRRAATEEGFVVRPGSEGMICGQCLLRYMGHETVDDEEKVRSR